MKKNMGAIDRLTRILVAAIVTVLYLTNIITGILAIVLLALSAVFVLTGVLGFCPLYVPLTVSTRHKEQVR